MQFPTTNDANIEKFKGVIYGDANAGKTTLARTCLELGKTLIINCESGLKPLFGYGIPFYDCHNIGQLAQLMQMIHKGELRDFDVLYVDSLTEICKIIERNLFERFATLQPNGIYDVDKRESFKYYGALAREIESFIRLIRDQKQSHVFFTALAQSWENDKTGEGGVRPALVGKKVSELLPGLFDFIFVLRKWQDPESGETRRALFTDTYEGYFAKGRQPVDAPELPLVIENPNLSEIVKRVTATPAKAA